MSSPHALDTAGLDLTADALAVDAPLDGYSGAVADSCEGRWTIEAAMEAQV